jgi:uncharacterized membrane protein YGL010W
MNRKSKLMDMLVGYAAAHQHPFNVAVHMIGIPTIMLGVMIPLTWFSFGIDLEGFSFRVSLAHVVLLAFFFFYLTLDIVFAFVFLIFGFSLVLLAGLLGELPQPTASIIAASAFFGGYLAQFVGHAVEKSMPVLLRHPIQANVAAPFFTIVEIFHITGLRKDLFDEVKAQIEARRSEEASASQAA